MIPKYTIFMPVVKTGYFKEAFESALNQSFQEFEILVIDNCADADVSWVDEYPNVRFVKNKTQLTGPEDFNLGIQLSRGEYIFMLSDDDMIDRNFLSEIDAFLKKINFSVDVVRVLCRVIDENGNTFRITAPGKEIERIDEFIYNQYTFFRGHTLTDIVFRRGCAIEVGGQRHFPMGWAADHCLAIEIGAKKNAIAHLNKVLTTYRNFALNSITSVSRKRALDRMIADFKFYEVIMKILAKLNENVYRQLALSTIKKYLQKQQDSNFATALIFSGFLGFYRFYLRTPKTPVSRLRSFFWALLCKIRHFTNLK
jgi:glycosyltransferase involved in cell wall biosynthesis